MVTERQQFLETLRAAHDFPTRYEFKLIGDNAPQLMDGALAVMRAALPEEEAEVSRRLSGKGNHQSITLVLRVPDAETVHSIYAELRELPGIRVLL
jgi:putative lipoic acid-binding regulatory protein